MQEKQASYAMEEDQEDDKYSVAYDEEEEEPHELVMHDVYVAPK